MQIDPIKHTLKAPGTKRLKLNYDKLLSNLAFTIKLRRYIQGRVVNVVGRCRLTLSNPR